MLRRIYFSAFLILILSVQQIFAQYDAPLYTSYTTIAARAKLHERLVNYSIIKNLSTPLNDSTEEKWEEAFDAIEILLYKSPFSDKKIHGAFEEIENRRSIDFQKALLQLAYTNYPGMFDQQVKNLLHNTNDAKVFAMCAEYIFQQKRDSSFAHNINKIIETKFGDQGIIDPVLYMLQVRISENIKQVFLSKKLLAELLSKKFLPGQTVMYSIQRKNRDYPGLVLIRNGNGDFIKDSNGIIFSTPQLARSTTNLPFYLRGGNTPQGIFLMHGFGVSMSSFIGPTANIQLSMPVEASIKAFMRDSSISDTIWNIDYYNKLIPEDFKNYLPLYYSYYAGQAGRTEIIAHGTTIDPNIYSNKPWFPLTPSQGCLCTKELWNGKRIDSDQQKLVNALLKAGGANGYCIVIELDDKQSAVTLADVFPFLNR
jgi:hypothetical protein